ncbi:MAG TPA: response regulator [Vicinamibacteria bacterium]|nr:response regulator [Vicinamibacteria bacterium]
MEEALASVEAESPHPVVNDIGMPGADGYALPDHLRERAQEDGPPTVALTAYASPDDAARALAAGFRTHVAKPVDPRDVVDTLAGLLRGMTRRGEDRQG